MYQLRKNDKALRVGLGFAFGHLVIFLVFLLATGFALGGESRLLWALWIPIDFPVSMLVGLGFDHIPTSNAAFQVLRTWWPLLVHGFFGTAWWFIAPFLLVRLVERRNNPKSK